mmetsp:Transcript_5033/g.11111  ORF Transcript_5033/g.11111 Transcript_5033/m.11111 type:complete len:217 (+) Transcript_5033:504-1154(+)
MMVSPSAANTIQNSSTPACKASAPHTASKTILAASTEAPNLTNVLTKVSAAVTPILFFPVSKHARHRANLRRMKDRGSWKGSDSTPRASHSSFTSNFLSRLKSARWKKSWASCTVHPCRLRARPKATSSTYVSPGLVFIAWNTVTTNAYLARIMEGELFTMAIALQNSEKLKTPSLSMSKNLNVASTSRGTVPALPTTAQNSLRSTWSRWFLSSKA